MRLRHSLRLGASLVGAICLCAAHAARADTPPQPRRLEYRVAWNGIPAAGATVAITPTELSGRDAYVVEATARTNAFVDLFWSYRGRVRATFLADGLTPLQFVYDRQMAGRPYVTWIDFARDERRASSVSIKGARRRELSLEGADILDPITAVFRARLSGARPGETLRYDVWTGEARYRVQLDVGAAEPIEVPAGRFSALPVDPVVWKVEGAAEPDTRLRAATIWVADDPARTLLRIRSEIFVGAITLDLVKLEPAA